MGTVLVGRTDGGMGAVQAISRAKHLVRHLAANAYSYSPGYLQALRGRVAILTYHRVVRHEDLPRQYIQPGMYVTTETFEKHAKLLQDQFDVISFPALLRMWDEQTWDARRRYCVITFDDGWLDNYTQAFPILKCHGIPASIFLPTAFVGTNDWFWPEKAAWVYRQYAAKSESKKQQSLAALEREDLRTGKISRGLLEGGIDALIEGCKAFELEQIERLVSRWLDMLDVRLPVERQVINWDEARVMSAAGITFGSHSVNHAILTKLKPQEVWQEIKDSWKALTQHQVNSVPVFCYPNGDWSTDIGQAVKAAGYRAAITTEFGYEGPAPAHQFGLKRINVHDRISSTENLFAFHLAGYNNGKWR